jgi:predicted nucleic-acid-binding protein
MRTDRIVIEDIQIVWKAIETFKETKADFADCLLAQRNLQAGCQYTATLDDAASVTTGHKHLLGKSKRV